MKPKKLFLAVCLSYHNVPPPFVVSLAKALMNVSFGQVSLHTDALSVFQARNKLTAEFLKTDCTHLVFVDSDIVFEPHDLEMLTSHSEELVAGVYAIKEDGPLRWALNTFDTPRAVQSSGLMEVQKAATGFMCIARNVIEKLIWEDGPAFEYKHESPPFDKEHHLWRLEVHGGRLLTEDWLFCKRWRDSGGKVFVDTRINLGHVGPVVFPLQAQLRDSAIH
jgi:hypothetical protein